MSYRSSCHDGWNNDAISRKRVRHNDYNSKSATTAQQRTPCMKFKSTSIPSSASCLSLRESPSDIVNRRYRIAGGLDTPSTARLEAEERQEEVTREAEYRPDRSSLTAKRESTSHFPQTPAEGAGIRHPSHKRGRSSHERGWGMVVMNMVGGVAGKVFNFCWNGAFRGFQAGGGQAYKMDSDTPTLVGQGNWMNVGEKDDVFHENYECQPYRNTITVPGQFPEEGFINDYMSDPSAYQGHQLLTPVSNAAERRILRGKWVLVDRAEEIRGGNHSAILPAHRNSRTAHHQKQPTSRTLLHTAGNRPRLVASGCSPASSSGSPVKRPASFASPRASRRRTTTSETNPFTTASDGYCRSRSSIASPKRASRAESKQGFTTPTSPDVHRFERKIRQKERKDDESMQRLNRQLQDMIKEGKEALGTRIDIADDEDDDEGYGEGAEMMSASKW